MTIIKRETRFDNPFWDAVKQHVLTDGTVIPHGHTHPDNPDRDELSRRYCWSIPDPLSLDFIAWHSGGRLIDFGAGTGYWSYLLVQTGEFQQADSLVAVDIAPPDLAHNKYHARRRTHFPVHAGDESTLARYPAHTVLLAYPESDEVFRRMLEFYHGPRVIVVGVISAMVRDAFGLPHFQEMMRTWGLRAEHVPVRWAGSLDRIVVLDRPTDV